ncbi:MAG: NAD-dependent succinate-semialdehyde dehydrogenase [Verrucomicrobiota bacterium]
MPFTTHNPTTGESLAEYPETTGAEAAAATERASLAQEAWRETGFAERGGYLLRLADAMEADQSELAALAAREMGKPVAEARGEIKKCALLARHAAGHAAVYLADEPVATEARASYIRYEPLGVILAIMPWNFPYWQICRCAFPALMAGNAVLVKPAPETIGCAERLQQLAHDAGWPEHLMQTVLTSNDTTAEIIRHPAVHGVALTGSTEAGRAVGAVAGAALKPVVLELGGSDPYLILADADLEAAVEATVASRMIAGGQCCVSAKRLVVERPVAANFERLVVEKMRESRMGDPLEEEVTLGPLARADLRDHLHQQVQASLAAGAQLLLGGQIPDGAGYFYPATVVAGVLPGMPLFEEETFGPVAAITEAEDAEHAIALANQTAHGLGAGVFTRDVERGREIAARRLQAGAVAVNTFVKSDPRLPFGGIGASGHGRELGALGMREFCNAKSVWVS